MNSQRTVKNSPLGAGAQEPPGSAGEAEAGEQGTGTGSV